MPSPPASPPHPAEGGIARSSRPVPGDPLPGKQRVVWGAGPGWELRLCHGLGNDPGPSALRAEPSRGRAVPGPCGAWLGAETSPTRASGFFSFQRELAGRANERDTVSVTNNGFLTHDVLVVLKSSITKARDSFPPSVFTFSFGHCFVYNQFCTVVGKLRFVALSQQ